MGELVNRGESAIVPEGFYKQVSSILNAARDKAYTAVNFLSLIHISEPTRPY